MSKEEIKGLFKEWVKYGCKECPFKEECDNVYSFTRMHSTNAITLCNCINMDRKGYKTLLSFERW